MRRILTLTAVLLSSTQLQAVDQTWLGTDTNYNNTANWSGGAIPTLADRAIFPSPTTANNVSFNQANNSVSSFRIDAAGYTFINGGGANPTFDFEGPGIENMGGHTFQINNSTGQINFNNASDANATTIGNLAVLTFNDTATAGSSNISNSNAASQLFFNNTATAGSSTININQGFATFGNNSSAGTSTITNTGGPLNFNDASSASNASVTNDNLMLLGNRTSVFELGALSGSGQIQPALANATLSVGHNNTDTTFTGTFEDQGGNTLAVTKEGTGTLTVTNVAHTFTGDVNINNGTLQWDGQATTGTNTNIGPNGTLSGTGQLIRNAVNNGIISPGNAGTPTATLTVQDYSGNGTVRLNVSPTVSGLFGPPFSSSDILVVRDADISGTTLDLTLAAGRYDPSRLYFALLPIAVGSGGGIVATSTITGQFLDITGLPARITATTQTTQPFGAGLDTVLLTLTEIPFADLLTTQLGNAGNADQRSLATALDAANSNPDFNDVIGVINTFATIDEVLRALDQLGNDGFNDINNFYATELITDLFSDGFESGNTSAWSNAAPYTVAYRPGVAAQTFRTRPQNLVARFRPVNHKRTLRDSACDLKDRLGVQGRDHVRTHIRDNPGTGHVWVQGFGGHADVKTTLEDIGYRGDTYGVMLGVDYQSSEDFRYGGAAGYSESTVDLNNKLGKAEVKSPFAAFWGHYMTGAYDVDFGLTFRRNDHNNKRFITFLPVNRTAQGKHKGCDFFPYIQGARHIALAEDVSLKPFVGVDFFHARENAFTETGAGGLNLKVKARNASLIQSKVGMGIDQHVEWCAGTSRHAISVSYKTRKPLGKQKTVSTFIGGTTPFVSTGNTKTKHRFGVNGDISFLWDNGTSLKASYHGDFGRNQSAHMALVSIGKSW